jgi:hypothetical protein
VSSEHPEGHEHDEQTTRPAGSGSSGPDTALKRQAGSYGRDAEQNPADAPHSTAETRDPKESRPGA